MSNFIRKGLNDAQAAKQLRQIARALGREGKPPTHRDLDKIDEAATELDRLAGVERLAAQYREWLLALHAERRGEAPGTHSQAAFAVAQWIESGRAETELSALPEEKSDEATHWQHRTEPTDAD